MDFSIVPFSGDSPRGAPHPMPPWPSLANNAFCLKSSSWDSIFFYDSSPDGNSAKPVIILIHGLGDEADSWRHLVPLLGSQGCRVLALDLPGFGRSAAPRKLNLKRHAAAVLRLIDALGQSSETGVAGLPPVFLAGNSLGAMVAEEAAFTRPDLIRGLVLLDGSIPGGPANPGLFALAKLLFSRKWYRAYRDNPDGAWASLYPYYADLNALSPQDREFLGQRVMARVESSTQERAYFATQSSLVRAFLLSTHRFSRKIRRFKGKILLIWGEKDRIIPLSSTETFKALRTDIELEIIPGAGHLPQQEKPVETARLIEKFVLSSH